MQLSNLSIAGQNGLKRIHIEKGSIILVEDMEIYPPAMPDDGELSFNNALAFPGLVNSHDHLDFNLFPQLGNGVYKSYKEWGTDIHLQNKDSIDRVLAVPRQLRSRWGVYKNLLSGITTVVHHGAKTGMEEDIISINEATDSYHSVSGEKGWRWKLINPFGKHGPVVIHIGEGTAPDAVAEINSLLRWNIFRRKLTGIHGVAMNEKQAAAFRSLVWCPASNYFLLNKTAPIDRLKHATTMLFGTDSTLTASWNIWEHLRLARKQQMASDTELFDMLTLNAAAIWRLKHSGSIEAGQQADIVVAERAAGVTGWDAFYAINPENILLLLHKGTIRLFDAVAYDQLVRAGLLPEGFSKVFVKGRVKYVQGDLPGLLEQIRQYDPLASFPVNYA
ncbi:MAG TPA: amidohydrolase family protein [Chitinophagaceae bacterium]